MDLFTLDYEAFNPVTLIQGYKSAIWTERIFEHGDFKIVVPEIEKFIELLPLGSLIGNRETSDVMMVETHLIERDANRVPMLTVSGRSLTSFLENRVAAAGLIATTEANYGAKVQDWDDNTGLVVQRLIANQISVDLLLDDDDQIDNVIVYTDPLVEAEDEGANATFDIPLGDVSTRARELLASVGLGMVISRPIDGSGTTQLWFVITRGLDRTINQDDNAAVVLRTADGHFETTSHLMSIRGYKNVAYVFSPLGSLSMHRVGTPLDVAGLDKRDLYVDASDLTALNPGQTLHNVLTRRARSALALPENNKTTIFDGNVNPTIPYTYGVDYKLGDLITVEADYGLVQTMLVSEYIRSESSEGDIGYPTLVGV